MDVSRDVASLLRQSDHLPPGLVATISPFDGERFLQTLPIVLSDRRYTDLVLKSCESLLPHCCSVLATRSEALVQSLAVFGRVLPFAPYLVDLAKAFLQQHRDSIDRRARETHCELEYLLALHRLIQHDYHTFATFISLSSLRHYVDHAHPAVRCIAVSLLAKSLSAADAANCRMYAKQVPADDAFGPWEHTEIHYKYLTLWETQRTQGLRAALKASRYRGKPTENAAPPLSQCLLSPILFHLSTAVLGGVLLPRSSPQTLALSSCETLVHTATTTSNLRRFASRLKSSKPLLIHGLPGAGKTSLVRYAAHALHKADTLVTLHLNEQSDSKSLIGLYTSGSKPGTFEWQPGVLTKAVTQGRWLLIEDLDRAPTEILSALLSLIERRKLLIPGQQRTIHAASGFRIIGTVRTSLNSQGEVASPATTMLGARHWRTVRIDSCPTSELSEIIVGLHPCLHEHAATLISVYNQLQDEQRTATVRGQSKTGIMRHTSLRDLLKWAARVADITQNKTSMSPADHDQIFLAAVDCFAGSLPQSLAKDNMVRCIAQSLQINPQRSVFLITSREVRYTVAPDHIVLGRHSLNRQPRNKFRSNAQRAFSTNAFTLRLMDRIASGVIQKEPLLLVGETGTGKTTVVQHLADQLGKRLWPFNLSQQSESGDLIGGFKPVNIRSLMVQLKEEFDIIFHQSFSTKVILRNQPFVDLLGKCMARGKWREVCKLWNKALAMVSDAQTTRENTPPSSPSPFKKRKTSSTLSSDILARWDEFARNFRDVEKRLIAGGQSSFAFAFVEGELVKAVRNGDWVLLDEINLASPDTLESIVELLDDSPSLTLSETGNVERVQAHKDFRIFAAMNPATDVGKKDLPLGVRSRFTELYVESPDRDPSSLQHIIKAYLGPTENALIAAVSILHSDIQRLSAQDSLIDGAGQRPHYSLRTLTRALTYATDIASQCSLRRALAESFQMSYATILHAESEARVELIIRQHLYQTETRLITELKQPMRAPREQANSSFLQFGRYWLRRGALDVEDQPQYIITDFVRRNLDKLTRAASASRSPILLQGPTSSGKTSMIEYLARMTGNAFVRINNHEHTDLQEYLGSYASTNDGRIHFQEGVLVKALREGHWVVLDELNLAPTDVLEALNRLLDDNRELLIPETQEIVRPHKNFMLFATQNPAGLYGGRKFLSRAFRNRFLELYFNDIPIDELHIILQRRTRIPPSWSQRIVSVYKELSLLRQKDRVFEQKGFATLRDLFRWASRPAESAQQLAVNGFFLLAERVRDPTERQEVKRVIEKVLSQRGPKVEIDEAVLYSLESLSLPIELQLDSTGQGIVWTSAMRRLYVLTQQAVLNDEPVLLIGDTGCGKTSVCQLLASVLGKDLHIVNAHQNLETGDLIGAQRPVRNRSAIEQQLRDLVVHNLGEKAQFASTTASLQQILLAYDTEISLDSQLSEQASLIHELRQRLNVLFEWHDGSLIEAMKTGQMFLLDEISLADDSVLERLNSLLEPKRSMLLAEKGFLDAEVTANVGFQFLATMNPGGDYGKKELSPALRNRFTEIWVPPLSNLDDMTQVLSAKLSAPELAQSMAKFAQWFTQRYDKSATDTISMRDLLTWVSFANRYPSDLPHGLVHGAALVYIDGLGANPAALLNVLPEHLSEERLECVTALERIFDVDARAVYSAPIDWEALPSVVRIGAFEIPRRADENSIEEDHQFTLLAQTTRSNAMRIVRALQLSKPILLEGNPGVGKTSLVTALANLVRVPLTRINLSEQTDLMDLFGSDSPVEGASAGVFKWRDASFLRAMKNGEWVLLDEMNLASQSVLEGLNACLDHRGEVYIAELQQTFHRHSDFRLFAAQNPHHQGGGRKGLPSSFVNRFTVVYADVLSRPDLFQICNSVFGRLAPGVISRIVEFVGTLDLNTTQRRLGVNGSPWEFNLRDTLRWLSLCASDTGLFKAGKAEDFLPTIVVQRFRTLQDQARALALYNQDSDVASSPRQLYHNITHSLLQVGTGLLHRDLLVASEPATLDFDLRPHLSAMESLMISVQQNWPVILVGPSGCGKTALLETLANLTGAKLVTMSLNADLDAADLVGGYEQLDPAQPMFDVKDRLDTFVRRVLLSQLYSVSTFSDVFSHLGGLLHVLWSSDLQMDTDIEEVLNGLIYLSQTLDKDLSEIAHSLAEEIGCLVTRPSGDNRGQFGWVDGMLVKAVERGSWLILDNANLCGAAALDRLNSLLEPNGCLIVNEHPSQDGEPHVIRPHPDFRIFLTMDPKHGELSRALRNRAIEIFIPLQDSKANLPLTLHSESRLHRLSNVSVLYSASSPDQVLTAAAEIVTGHFSIRDLLSNRLFLKQVQTGLFGVPPHLLENAMENIETTQALLSMDETSSDALTTLRELQTCHPWNNSIVSCTLDASSAPSQRLGFCFEMALAIVHMHKALRHVEIKDKPWQSMTRLQLSANRARIPNASKQSTAGVYPFLQHMTQSFTSAIQQFRSKGLDERTQHAFITLRQYWWALFELVKDPLFEDVSFATYREIGQDFLEDHDFLLLPRIDVAFNMLGTGSLVQNASSMTALWSELKSTSLQTFEQVQNAWALEELADKFDDQAWKFSTSLSDLATLRYSLQQALRSARTIGDGRSLIQTLETTLSGLDDTADAITCPHFSQQFETVCQLFDLSLAANQMHVRGLLSEAEQQSMSILSQRSTKTSLATGNGSTKVQNMFAKLASYAGTHAHDRQHRGLAVDLETSILDKLETIKSVPISRIDLLKAESNALGRLYAKHAHNLGSSQLQELDVLLRQLTDQIISILPSSSQVNGSLNERESQDVGYVSNVVRRHFSPVFGYIQDSLNNSPAARQRYTQASMAWLNLALGCFKLYMPNGSYDPALKPVILHEMFQKHRSTILDKLQALQEFELYFSGQRWSPHIGELRNEMARMGSEPIVKPVARPSISELPQLQAVFDAMYRILGPLTDCTDESSMALVTDAVFASNLVQLENRLRRDFRAYEDITGPLLGFVDILKISIELAKSASGQFRDEIDDNMAILHATPMFWGLPQNIVSGSTFSNIENVSMQVQLHFLRTFAFAKANSTDGSELNQVWPQVHRAFVRAYQKWRAELSSDQKEHATNKSLYRFIGGDEIEEEADDDDFRQLFGIEDDDTKAHRPQTPSTMNIYGPAFADIVAGLFSGSKESSLTSLIQHAQRSLTVVGGGRGIKSIGGSLAPILVKTLDATDRRLQSGLVDRTRYNIYTDPNIAECRNLLDLVKKVRYRFASIQKTWPEHATLADVLKVCDELGAFSHLDPLAKIITKLEKLHEHVHEWQRFASSEFSAAAMYDAITNLIVSWRQLELSTWSHMLDNETVRCLQEAKSWWFVAFENVIAVPISFEELDGVHDHTVGLISTLEAFFLNTGLGQFTERLRIVEHLQRYARYQSASDPILDTVSNALENFIAYMQRFESRVGEALSKGRNSLAKEMRDVIRLASWKDRNIDSLRQSAKTSHRKLFRYIRKYRSLLGQPVSRIILSGGNFTLLNSVMSPFASAEHVPSNDQLVTQPRHRRLFDEHLINSGTIPTRFTKISATVKVMQTLTREPNDALNGPAEVETWLKDVVESVAQLRKSTPPTLTEDNKTAVQHLKAQKRKLFADVLRELRLMGFKAGIAGNDLSKQDSLKSLLTNMTPLVTTGSPHLVAAEQHLHVLMHYMVMVRNAAREHSEDLTGAEVARSIGLLEAMLQSVVRQRKTLRDMHDFKTSLRKLLKQTQDLQMTRRVHVLQSIPTGYDLHTAAVWMPSILATTANILQCQARLGDIEIGNGVEPLNYDAEHLRKLHAQLSTHDYAVPLLSTAENETVKAAMSTQLETIKARLVALVDQHPSFGPVIEQAVLWATPQEPCLTVQEDTSHPGKYLEETTQFVDGILGSIESVQKALSTLPRSNEDPAWLAQENQALTTALIAARPQQMIAGLSSLLNDITKFKDAPGSGFDLSVAVISCFLPIFCQYECVLCNILDRLDDNHRATTVMSAHLARIFTSLAESGFCKPSEKNSGDKDQNEKLEGGTGLGDGEGGEDISKDIGDDEDMTELAQEPNEKQDREEIEDEKDAVDMADADMEGEMGEAEDKADEDKDGDEDDDKSDMEEEVGDVDDLGPSTVDEKMWDNGGKDDEARDKEGDNDVGTADENELAAAGDEKDGTDDKNDAKEDKQSEEEEEVGVDESEEVDTGDIEKTDPHLKEEENLDLPDDIDMGEQDGGAEGMSDASDFGDDDQLPQEADQENEMEEGKEMEDGDDARSQYSATPEMPEDEVGDPDEKVLDDEDGDQKTQEAGEDTKEEAEDDTLLQDGRQDESQAAEKVDPSQAQGTGLSEQQDQNDDTAGTQQASAEQEQGNEGKTSEMQQMAGAQGRRRQAQNEERADADREQDDGDDEANLPFKKLGDALDDWYKQRQQIADAQNAETERRRDQVDDLDMAEAEFEHLPDDSAMPDAQALGAATEEQATAIEEDAGLATNERETREHFAPDEEKAEDVGPQVKSKDDDSEPKDLEQQPVEASEEAATAFVGKYRDQDGEMDPTSTAENEADIEELDHQIQDVQLSSDLEAESMDLSAATAREIWLKHESATHTLALTLTEHLRLILSPTTATRLRGDFRTGKRLNMKRIIPYIASQYKRDKIWMRRSVPSKRAYQIMLAVDDSKSMGEDSQTAALAFDTLALISRSLSMLEAGDLCIVRFGTGVDVIHPFGTPFTTQSGAQVVGRFKFDQSQTVVQTLLETSLDMFAEARAKAASSVADLWQLQFIISDGVCRDHAALRQLVRRATEAHIMIVFVIVDPAVGPLDHPADGASSTTTTQKKNGILDLQTANFSTDLDGNPKVETVRYLETFPFRYYLIVRDTQELPSVLASALRQWFAEVVDTGS